MAGTTFHLAQLNISHLRAPLDAPELKEFVDFLDPVNRFAEESPGFVWRLTGDDGQSSSFLPTVFDDPMTISNLTVWVDLSSLQQFAYQTVHRYFLQNRRKWFDHVAGPQVVMWWIPAGEIPTLGEGKRRLERLGAQGPTPSAFTLVDAFDAGGRPLPRAGKVRSRPGAAELPDR